MHICWRHFGLALATTAALTARAAGAPEDFDDKPLSLRLPAALTRFASYADVAAAGGASAASKWSSSMNPASVGWESLPGGARLSLSPQYYNLEFDEGTRFHVTAEALVVDAARLGTFQPSLAQVRSNRKTTRQGLDFRFDMDYVQVQWGKRLSDDTAVGANFNFAKAKSQFDLGQLPVSDSVSETYGFRFGALHRLAERWLAGVVFDYGFTPSRTTLYDFMGLGTGDMHVDDTAHQYVLRPGVSYEYLKESFLYADYQFGTFLDDTGRLVVHRFYLGADHRIVKGLFVRGGAALDTRGNASWTTGLGIYPCDRFSIDMGFQDNMFPELEPDLGRSRGWMISLSISF